MPRVLLSIVLPAALIPLAVGAPQSDDESPRARSEWRPRAIELPEEPVVVHFEPASSRPIPVVEVHLGDEGPYRFFLDTGAALCVVDERLARSLDLELGDERGVGDLSGSPLVPAREVRLPSLQLGAARFLDVPAVSMARRRFGATDGVRGILGLPLASECLLTIHFPSESVVLRRGALPEADGEEVFDVRLHEGLPLLELEVEGRQVDLRIDSGQPNGIILPRAFAEDLAWKREPEVRGRGRTVNSEFEIWRGRLDGTVRLGAHVFEAPYVTLNDALATAYLGYRALEDFEVTFDLVGRRVRVDRPGALEQRAGPLRAR